MTLGALDEEALISILQEPKNALVKQYKKLFDMDKVELEFEKDALNVIAKKAIERKTGARGLRSIIERIMTDVMFEIPSRDDIEKVIITKESVDLKNDPLVIFKNKTKGKIKDLEKEEPEETA